MGLSASQGRLLLLTARKSDLEFQAQQISQKRLVLSQQLDTVARDYEDSTSNRKMKISLYLSASDSEKSAKVEKNLTYANLISGLKGNNINDAFSGINTSSMESEYNSNVAYRLVDTSGAIVVADESEISTTIPVMKDNKVEIDDKTQEVKTTTGTKAGPTGDGLYTIKDANGAVVRRYKVDPSLKNGGTSDASGDSTPNYLQDCLRNGKYLIEKGRQDQEDPTKTIWNNISWDATANIEDNYYLEDDDTAKAKYDRLQNQIQAQDKKLELELNNIESQRNAVNTETDSVEKVISDNIEKTFKTFA